MRDNKDFKDLKAMAGAYKPGFMQIKLTHQFQKGFGDFTIEQLGVFFHEFPVKIQIKLDSLIFG